MSLNLVLVLILVGGWLFGRLFSLIGLPNVLGMLLWGLGLGFFYHDQIPSVLWELIPFVKSLALLILMLRSGLALKRRDIRRAGAAPVLMGIFPFACEGAALSSFLVWGLGWEPFTAAATGFLLSAVSPAVVVPSMLSLKERGYGDKNQVPTVALAGAALDNVLVIAAFSFFVDLAKGGAADWSALLRLPLSLAGGIIPGLLLGFFLVWFLSRHHEKIRATEKTLLLIGLGLLLLQVGDWLHTAAILGILTVGFILLEKAPQVAQELAQKLNKSWVAAEIVLFVLIGLSVKLDVALQSGLTGLLIVGIGLSARALGVAVATAFSPMNWRERLFCAAAFVPKATVQAALASVPLTLGLAHGEQTITFAVVAILVTSPLGLVLIKAFGSRLLRVELPVQEQPPANPRF